MYLDFVIDDDCYYSCIDQHNLLLDKIADLKQRHYHHNQTLSFVVPAETGDDDDDLSHYTTTIHVVVMHYYLHSDLCL